MKTITIAFAIGSFAVAAMLTGDASILWSVAGTMFLACSFFTK